MKLYSGTHTCAIGTHILLEEIGKPYETEKIDVAGGANKEDWFKAINPKSKVPTLMLDDGRVLTEFGPIGVWLARNNPDARLLPTEPNEEFRALSTIDYVVGTIHGQGFGRIFMPAKIRAAGSGASRTGAWPGLSQTSGRNHGERGVRHS